MEVLSWILNIAIVIIAVFWNMNSVEDARNKGYNDGFERGKKSAEDDAYKRVGKTMENLLHQIEANEKEITSLKSQLFKLKDKKENSLISVNDLLFRLYLMNKKDLVKIDGIELLSDADQVTFKNKNGELQNGMSLVFKNHGWFVPFDKNLGSEMLTDEKIPRLVLSVYTENPMGERKNVTFNNPLSVHLTLPES
jgi:hypothetical protein